jgi:hypothetical protein
MTEDGFEIRNVTRVMPDKFERIVEIDNGEVKGRFLLGDAHYRMERLVGKDAANKLCWEVTKFQEDVVEERSKGTALGSTDLRAAIENVYYDPDRESRVMDPEELGLTTDIEVKLAARLMGTFFEPSE